MLKPPSQESVSSYITRIMRGLKLEGVSHHTMRHTGVTLMLEAGVNPRVIQAIGGLVDVADAGAIWPRSRC